ncbi:hypothetical protein C8R46DRAFT_1040595 [Mycena filopes]|nr:hypothetical protein C8R46DRAFT_1040595 [Mycena filopes]
MRWRQVVAALVCALALVCISAVLTPLAGLPRPHPLGIIHIVDATDPHRLNATPPHTPRRTSAHDADSRYFLAFRLMHNLCLYPFYTPHPGFSPPHLVVSFSLGRSRCHSTFPVSIARPLSFFKSEPRMCDVGSANQWYFLSNAIQNAGKIAGQIWSNQSNNQQLRATVVSYTWAKRCPELPHSAQVCPSLAGQILAYPGGPGQTPFSLALMARLRNFAHKLPILRIVLGSGDGSSQVPHPPSGANSASISAKTSSNGGNDGEDLETCLGSLSKGLENKLPSVDVKAK